MKNPSRYAVRPEYQNLAEKLKSSLGERLILNANTVLQRAMSDEKLDKANFFGLIKGFEIMLNSGRLLRGESTENISVMYRNSIDVSNEYERLKNSQTSIEADIAQLEARIAKMSD